MAQKDTQPFARRKRVQILKRLIIILLMTFILIPIVLCIILFSKVSAMEKQLSQLTDMVAALQTGQMEATDAEAQDNSQTVQEDLENPQSEDTAKNVGDTAEEVGKEELSGDASEEKLSSDNSKQKIYLTFDDGPSSNTNAILDILAEYDVKATFFVVGKEGEWAEEAYKRIVEEGHTLAMHSYTHEYKKIYASVEAYAEDLNKLKDYLYDVTGVDSQFVRFPGGSSNRVSKVSMREIISYLNEQEMTYFDWNVSSQDASSGGLSAQQILDNCLNGITNQDTVMILMHDTAGKKTTVEALPKLIEAIQAMDNTELLPITEDTVPVQHIKNTQDETEE